jgi:hypothetical protein
MTINTDLLLEIREQIASHPETHDQSTWASRTDCGTTYCIAGWAAMLTGAQINWYAYEFGPTGEGAITVNADSYTETVEGYAARVMGLDGDQCELFVMNNDDALVRLDQLIEEGKNAA